MIDCERKIVINFDLDGPKMLYPAGVFSLRTSFDLFRGELKMPPRGVKLPSRVPSNGPSHFLYALACSVFHGIRPVNKEAVEGIHRLIHLGQNIHDRKFECNVITAREPDLLNVTERKLQAAGLMGIFKHVYLNHGLSACPHKETTTETMIDNDPYLYKTTYIQVDDDIRAGKAVARINDRFPGEWKVLSYVFKNASNSSFLLERGNTVIPRNLILVNNFNDAIHDIWLKIVQDKI